MKITPHIVVFLIVAFGLGSCSLSKSLPEDTYVYHGAKIDLEKADKSINTKALEDDLSGVLKTPRPNRRFLGIRWGLRFHNLFYTEKEKGFKHWLQKNLGEEPVLYSDQVTKQTEELINNRAFNNGFFNTEVYSDVLYKKKEAKVTYKLFLNRPYTIARVENRIDDPVIYQEVAQMMDSSLVRVGQAYQLDRAKQERQRIETALRKKGFYFFQDDYLLFKADTTLGRRQIRVQLLLKEEAPRQNLKRQYIDSIFVYPDYNFSVGQVQRNNRMVYDDMTILYDKLVLQPKELEQTILFNPGEPYSVGTHQKTLQRLSFLQVYQFIDLQFERNKNVDSLLKVKVFLSPRDKHNVEGSVGLSLQSNAFLGPEFSLTYTNRNLFRGAEQFRFRVFSNFNFPLKDALAYQEEIGANVQLTKPGLVLPFRKRDWSEKLIMRTGMRMNYSRERVRVPLKGSIDKLSEDGELLPLLLADSTFAPFVALNNLDINFGYQWYKRTDIRHEFNPVELALQAPRYQYEELQSVLAQIQFVQDTSLLNLNLARMVIFRPNYTFLYDSRLKRFKWHNFFYRGRVSFSGNMLLTSDGPSEGREGLFFQTEQDFRYYWKISKKNIIAFRFATSFAVPLRQNSILPFFDLYSVGGPNSVRAFRARQLGPGSLEPSDEIFFFTGKGDIRWENSLEWRWKITPLIELGTFVDAGNVWLWSGGSTDSDLAVFHRDEFLDQLGVGTGLGIRADFDILLIRLDLSFPLSKPWLPKGERWVTDEIAFGKSSWRRENLIFHFAFGYPF